MTKWIVAGLIVLNLLLGAGLFFRMGGEKTANAQIGATQSDYTLVSGYANQQSVLYMLQLSTGRLIAIRVDPINHDIKPVAGRNVTQDIPRTH